jgi:Flp pilus assembly protein TadG
VVVEMGLVAVPLLALVMLIPFAGRIAAADADVASAAAEAARAASLRSSPGAAHQVATGTAAANLGDDGWACQSFDVDVDAGALAPGGSVSVTVSCSVSHADLLLVVVPGDRTFTATASEVVDTFRGDGL